MREVIVAPLAGLDLRQHYGHHQSPAIRAGGLIFCSGMLPVDPETGERRHGTLTSEAHVIFGNLKALLESAGSSLDRLVQVHALIYDSIEYDVLNRVYRQYVANGPPARTVWTAQSEAGVKIQLDAVAALGQPASTLVRGGPFLFVSGLVAVDPATGKRAPGTTASETRLILSNL